MTIQDLRIEYLTLPSAYVAICDLALDGTEPDPELWPEIEQLGIYEGATQEHARQWCEGVLSERVRT
jgi:hypothetical protein